MNRYRFYVSFIFVTLSSAVFGCPDAKGIEDPRLHCSAIGTADKLLQKSLHETFVQ